MKVQILLPGCHFFPPSYRMLHFSTVIINHSSIVCSRRHGNNPGSTWPTTNWGHLNTWPTSSRAKRLEVVLACLWIGHSKLNHSHLISGNPAPYCEGCLVPLTVVHMLTEWPEYSNQRQRDFGADGMRSTIGLADIIKDDRFLVESLLLFLTDCSLMHSLLPDAFIIQPTAASHLPHSLICDKNWEKRLLWPSKIHRSLMKIMVSYTCKTSTWPHLFRLRILRMSQFRHQFVSNCPVPGFKMTSYSNDLIVLSTAPNNVEAEMKVNQIIMLIVRWADRNPRSIEWSYSRQIPTSPGSTLKWGNFSE